MQVRQGDILIERVEALPQGLEVQMARNPDGPLVLAEGEASGHAHRVETDGEASFVPAEPSQADPTRGWLTVKAEARPVHDEHGPLDLRPSNYEVVQQRRYDPRREGSGHATD